MHGSSSEAVATPLPCVPAHIQSIESMRAWILEWLGRTGSEEKEIVLRVWYELWLAHNAAKDSKRIEDPTSIRDRVLYLAMEWKTIHEVVVRHREARALERWKKPEEGWVKTNANGALSKMKGSGGGGAVLRDNHGEFLAGCCRFFPSTQ